MKDKLDIFVNMVKSGMDKDDVTLPFVHMLKAVSDNSDAFLFLYESLPEDVRPKFDDCTNYFRDIFVNVISKQDERTFNNYFFSGLHEKYDIDELRNLHFKFPENEKLKEYVKEKDNPKNIDQVVHVLYELWKKNSDHYPEMLNRYVPKLYNLSKLKGVDSRAAKYFSWWAEEMIQKDGLENFFDFCQTIKLEPYSFCRNTQKNFSLKIDELSEKDLEFLINYGEKIIALKKYPGLEYSYPVVSMMGRSCSLTYLLKKISEHETPENLSKFALLWKTQESCFKNLLLAHLPKGQLYKDYNTFEVMYEFLEKKFDTSKHVKPYSSSLGVYADEFSRIMEWGRTAGLQTELSIKNEQSSKKKLKI